ncbi:hypothetical protein DFH27DRAFT_522174 [Peziza echinospora]|nr:hypothetical protein DFH27DRAFT_522174 [Peziza echinospora]
MGAGSGLVVFFFGCGLLLDCLVLAGSLGSDCYSTASSHLDNLAAGRGGRRAMGFVLCRPAHGCVEVSVSVGVRGARALETGDADVARTAWSGEASGKRWQRQFSGIIDEQKVCRAERAEGGLRQTAHIHIPQPHIPHIRHLHGTGGVGHQ